MKKILCLLILVLGGCATKTGQNDELVSIQILDRNGFSETIASKDRLNSFDKTDFLTTQPYQKVTRVYGKSSLGKTTSKLTTYHSNGQPWQYLEIENGRAHGLFNEWHSNGKLKIEAHVIEGTADVSEMGQMTWFFDGKNSIYDEQGQLIAELLYDKGIMEGASRYYHPDGALQKEIPYHKDEIDGLVQVFDPAGNCLEKTPYLNGSIEGLSVAYWSPNRLKSTEEYQKDLLLKGEYFDPEGKIVAQVENGEGIKAVFEQARLKSLFQYRDGIVDGKVENFDEQGRLTSTYHIKDGVKNGDEFEYYPSFDKEPHPKLFLQWQDDVIHGICKTWYPNNVLESQREFNNNKMHGLSFAWYTDGDLMLMEDYSDDQLMKGSYYKKWEKKPVSKIENGKGTATLFDKEGKFLKKVVYEKGLPQRES